MIKNLNSEAINVVPLPEGYSRQINLYEVFMTSLQGAKKWSHEGFRYFLMKY